MTWNQVRTVGCGVQQEAQQPPLSGQQAPLLGQWLEQGQRQKPGCGLVTRDWVHMVSCGVQQEGQQPPLLGQWVEQGQTQKEPVDWGTAGPSKCVRLGPDQVRCWAGCMTW